MKNDAPQRPIQRFDERDTMFARMARREGTQPYEDYYSRRPDLQKTDDRIRNMPGLCEPGGLHYDPEISSQADRYFEEIYDIKADTETITRWNAKIGESSDRTGTVKELALSLGAVAVGCAPLEQEFIYTHKGRLDEDYSHVIQLDHPSVIVFLVEMDFGAMQRAPKAETIRESARQYYRAAVVSKTIEAVLKASGFKAKSHHDAHYDIILPPVADRAGLGEVGRNNILIAENYGSRVRIGAITTDMPLEYDKPVDLGAEHFCGVCKKCAENCPSHALSLDDKEEVRGNPKWPTDVERCYAYWRAVGTDCGICMAACPFSHKNNGFHNMVRWMVRVSPGSHRILLLLDQIVYGRTWHHGKGWAKDEP